MRLALIARYEGGESSQPVRADDMAQKVLDALSAPYIVEVAIVRVDDQERP